MLNFTNAWHWPQWIVVGLWALRLLIHAASAGEPMEKTYNPFATLIGIVIMFVILAKGGFFQ